MPRPTQPGTPARSPVPPGLLLEAARQTLHLLGLVALADLVLRRAARGLAPSGPAGALAELGDAAAPLTREALVLAALLALAASLPLRMPDRRPGVRIAALAAGGLLVWLVGWRAGLLALPAPEVVAGALLAAALVQAAREGFPGGVLAALPAAGAAACTLWPAQLGPAGPTPVSRALEISGEALLLGGVAASLRHGARPPGGRLAAGSALLVLGLLMLLAPGFPGMLAGLLHLEASGLDPRALAVLLVGAGSGLAALAASGPLGRRHALLLTLLLLAARGPGPALQTLRPVMAALLVLESLTPACRAA